MYSIYELIALAVYDIFELLLYLLFMRKQSIDELNAKYLGKRFNKLVILSITRNEDSSITTLCECDCGATCNKYLHKVVSGSVKSCSSSIHRLEWGKNHSQYYKDHPEVGARAGEKIKEWYSNNKSIVDSRSDQHRQWWASNKHRISEFTAKFEQCCKDKRLECKFIDLLEIISPDYIEDLLSGNIKRNDTIMTKCPICGNYGEHRFHDIYLIGQDKLKYDRPLICSNCQQSKVSFPEQEIADYISEFYAEKPIRNDRSIIMCKELDLYYPEKKIAIEFNGIYWHSEKFKDQDYHYNKFKLCSDNDILLISVFEDQWNLDKDSIKLYIRDTFNDTINTLSYRDDGAIDLNFPIRDLDLTLYNIEPHSYIVNNRKVFTCGYAVKNRITE